jgi:hypothetical protein
MPNYENETCEGCVHYEDDETCGCVENWVDSPNVSGVPLRPEANADSERCENFKPSLECRKVLALEELAACCIGPRGGFYVEGPRDP